MAALRWKPDFARTAARFEAWWSGEMLDRPPVTLSVAPQGPADLPQKTHATERGRWLDAPFVVDCAIAWMAAQDWVGDSFPVFWPNVGPVITSALLGCRLEFDASTSWAEPIVGRVEDWDRIIATSPDWNHPCWQAVERMMDYAIAIRDGRYMVGLTDLHGNYDILAALRGTEPLCLDLLEDPQRVRRAGRHGAEIFVQAFNRGYAKLAQAGLGSTTWIPAYHQGPAYVPSCDFWCMVSPQMARDLILPDIVYEMQGLERSIFHLDGPQALQHLDLLLDLGPLNAVQWVFGAGHGPASRWIEVYRRIRKAGKSVQVLADDPADALKVLAEIGGAGVYLDVARRFASVADAEAFLAQVERCCAGVRGLMTGKKKQAKSRHPRITPLENFQRMMRRDDPQWLPLDLPVTAPAHDLIARHLGTRDLVKAFSLDFESLWAGGVDDPDAWRRAYARIGFNVPADAEIGGPGITHAVPPAETIGAAYHLREMLHPLSVITDVGQLEQLPWPPPDSPDDALCDPGRVKKIHDSGLVAVGGLECTVFELAWYLRGMDNLFMDLIEGNGISDWLLDWFMHRSVKSAIAFARAGVDVIALGDDVGTQRGMLMSVDFWRQHLKERLKTVIDAARQERGNTVTIKYHSDGNIGDIVPDLIEIGVDVLNPVQPECLSAKELVNAYKSKLGLWGMVGTQTTMPFGKPEDVRQVVREIADYARQGAAVIVAPTHVIEPDVPWENIKALVDAVKQTKLNHDG